MVANSSLHNNTTMKVFKSKRFYVVLACMAFLLTRSCAPTQELTAITSAFGGMSLGGAVFAAFILLGIPTLGVYIFKRENA